MNGFHMNQTQSYKGWHNLNHAYQDFIIIIIIIITNIIVICSKINQITLEK